MIQILDRESTNGQIIFQQIEWLSGLELFLRLCGFENLGYAGPGNERGLCTLERQNTHRNPGASILHQIQHIRGRKRPTLVSHFEVPVSNCLQTTLVVFVPLEHLLVRLIHSTIAIRTNERAEKSAVSQDRNQLILGLDDIGSNLTARPGDGSDKQIRVSVIQRQHDESEARAGIVCLSGEARGGNRRGIEGESAVDRSIGDFVPGAIGRKKGW